MNYVYGIPLDLIQDFLLDMDHKGKNHVIIEGIIHFRTPGT